ncbi:MAG: hypothetical protein RMZ43_036080, partial [Nostoc sp. CmiVER01]|uniref:hypothetical protein n=1 Tax=Nostoc sp. CmiVER01 TaxID=3075384 RepID=UPI003D160C34
MRSFQETIDARRRDLGLTVEDVFERLDRYAWPPDAKPPALATLGHWFNGTRRRPRAMIHIKALCDVLELEMGCAFGAPSLQTET